MESLSWNVEGRWWRVDCGGWAGMSKGQCPNKMRQADPGGWGGQTEAQTAEGIPSSSYRPGVGSEGRGQRLRALTRVTMGAYFLRTNERHIDRSLGVPTYANAKI